MLKRKLASTRTVAAVTSCGASGHIKWFMWFMMALMLWLDEEHDDDDDECTFGVKLMVGKEVHLWLPCCEHTTADEFLGTGEDSKMKMMSAVLAGCEWRGSH